MGLSIKHFNTWSGCLAKEYRLDFYEYLQKEANSADVLHLSEVHRSTTAQVPRFVHSKNPGHRPGPIDTHQFQRIKEILEPTHEVLFSPQLQGLHDCDDAHKDFIQYGNAVCIRKCINYNYLHGMIWGQPKDSLSVSPAPRSIQSVMINTGESGWYQSVHFHGIWQPQGKVDTPERVAQSENVLGFIEYHQKNHVLKPGDIQLVLGGDFNLTSKCSSLESLRASKLFGDQGGRILNHEFKLKDTRTRWYEKAVREADFVIASKDVKVRDFFIDLKAPSDHGLISTILQ